ncbi:hypothetical protein C2S52_010441 [Perilla frutescens var. hirtella]|nr:hypothetical protein C2S52_010441 [Perilla frutescens var. hirtella]
MGVKGSGKGVLLSRRSNLAVLNTIRENLDDVNFEKMKGSCFGHLFQQQEFICQGQLLGTLLKKLQRHSLKRMRLSFKINNDIEFGPKEFAVMAGLRLAGDPETPSTSAFYSDVFKNKKPLYFVDIEKKLEAAHKAGQTGSETSYKLALLLVVYGILLAKDRTSKRVTLEYLHVVDNVQRFNNFPWGKVTYEFQIRSMEQARSCLASAKRKDGRRAIDIHGFLYPVQAWLYEIMPSIASCYALPVGVEGDVFPRMLRWCVPKNMTTVYDEVRPFFSKKNSEVKRPLEMTAQEEPILLELGLHEFAESIESLRDAVDDYGSSDDCLDSSDDEISTDGAHAKGKRKLDGGGRQAHGAVLVKGPETAIKMIPLLKSCPDCAKTLSVARIADNVTAMQLDLSRLVNDGHGQAGKDMFRGGDGLFAGGEDVHIVGTSYAPHGVEVNEPATEPATEGVEPIIGASAQYEGGDEAMRAKEGSASDTESEDSDKTSSPREVDGKLNADTDASVYSEEEDGENQSSPEEEEAEEETKAEASDESSSSMEESGESETDTVQERIENEDDTKDAGESSSQQAADGVGIDSQPADTNADMDDTWDITLATFLGLEKAEASRASESAAESAAEGPSQPRETGAASLEDTVDAAMADWAEHPVVAPKSHDPSMLEPVSNPSLAEFRLWYNEQRKLPLSSQTEVRLSNHDLLWTTAPWFEGLVKRYGWLNTTHIDALLNLVLNKIKRTPDTFADNWAVIETYLWGTLQKGEVNYAVGTLVPYILGMSPRMLKRPWAKVDKVYGIGNVNDDHWVCYAIDLNQQSISVYDSQFRSRRWDDVKRHFTTISRYIPSACKKTGLWRKRQAPAAALLDQWPVVSNGDTPQQNNNHDCGIMALKVLECLYAGVPIHVIDPTKCGRYCNDYTAALFHLTKELGEEKVKQGRIAAAAFSTMSQRPRRGGQH